MSDDEADECNAGNAVQHVGDTPGRIAEQIRVARQERRPNARHHDDARDRRRHSDHDDGEMVQAVSKRVLARLEGNVLVAKLAEELRLEFGNVLGTHPDRPEVEEERGVNDVIDDRAGQHEAGNPVPLHPGEPHTNDREERR